MVEEIKIICKKKKLSIRQLEEKSGIPPNSIYRWDRNRPSVDSVAKVAATLNVTVDKIIGGEKKKE